MKIRWRPDRGAWIAILLLLALIVGSLPVWWLWGNEAVLVLAGLAYAVLTTWTNLEAREERLTRDRPFVFVDFIPRVEHQGSPGATLRIRNEGRTPATDIFLVPNVRLQDRDSKDLLQNPVLRDGVPFLAPGLAMSIDLHEGTILNRLFDEAPLVVPGQPSPSQRALRVTCRADYRDAITGRHYSDAFTVDLSAHLYGWTTSTTTA